MILGPQLRQSILNGMRPVLAVLEGIKYSCSEEGRINLYTLRFNLIDPNQTI